MTTMRFKTKIGLTRGIINRAWFSWLFLLAIVGITHIARASDLFDVSERALINGIGRPLPVGELINLKRSPIVLPNPPQIEAGKLVFADPAQRIALRWRVELDENLSIILKRATQEAIAIENQSKASDLAHSALLLALTSIAYSDSIAANEAWTRLQSLPPVPKSGGPSENDSGQPWGDLLDGSSALANAALAFDILRDRRPSLEQVAFSRTIVAGAERIRNGIEFIGPNNHASSTGANLAVALCAISTEEWKNYPGKRLQLWRIAERLLQIGLAQIGSDGVYREGPGYAQLVLRDLSRLSLILQSKGLGNLLAEAPLRRFAKVTAQLSGNRGEPLPFDDSNPIGGNLWQQVAQLLPNETEISQYARAPVTLANSDALLEIARYTSPPNSVKLLNRSTAALYRDGGMALLRHAGSSPWLFVVAGEPQNRWTGRHEQIDPGNIVCQVGSSNLITSGGYGPGGVNDRDRAYWMSGNAQSGFLVDGDPLHLSIDDNPDECSPTWDGVVWNASELYARATWMQSGVRISRSVISVGERVILFDRIFFNPGIASKHIEAQFQLQGRVETIQSGKWRVIGSNGRDTLQLSSFPETFGEQFRGKASRDVFGTEPIVSLRLPIQSFRATILTPGETHTRSLISVKTDSSDKLQWEDSDGTNWSLHLIYTFGKQKIEISGRHPDGSEQHFMELIESDSSPTRQLHLRDMFGEALYPVPASLDSRGVLADSVELLTYRSVPVSSDNRADSLSHHYLPTDDRDGWFVVGSPRFHLQETLSPPLQSRLERLTTTPSHESMSRRLATWNREDRAALEAEIADSLANNLSRGVDSLGIGRPLSIAIAAIDATTDGFAPGKFRIPFDLDETITGFNQSDARIRAKGRWGSGLSLDRLRFDQASDQSDWAIERSAPFMGYERYRVEWNNRIWSIRGNHSDGVQSDLAADYRDSTWTIGSTLQRTRDDHYALQSIGSGRVWAYAGRGSDSLINLQGQIRLANRLGTSSFGGAVSHRTQQNSASADGWCDIAINQNTRIWYLENGIEVKGRTIRIVRNLSPLNYWSVQYRSFDFQTGDFWMRGGLPAATPLLDPDAFQLSAQWQEKSNPWIQAMRVQLANKKHGIWSFFTEKSVHRIWGSEWRNKLFGIMISSRLAATDRIDRGNLSLGYIQNRFSGLWEGYRDPEIGGTTLSIGYFSESGSYWRISSGWEQPTNCWFQTPARGVTYGTIECQNNKSSFYSQRLVWRIGQDLDKSAEGGITLRW